MALVLVVERDLRVRLRLRTLLEKLGHVVLEEDDGALVLRAVSRFRPDLALVGADLPGVDGYGVCADIRADPAVGDTPLAMLSDGVRPSRSAALRAGADEVMSVAVTCETLGALVDRLVDGFGPRAPDPQQMSSQQR